HRFRFHHRLVPMALPPDVFAGMQGGQRYPVPSGAIPPVPAPDADAVTLMPGALAPVRPEPAPLLQPGQELVLRITTGAAAGATWPLMGSGLTIGRDIGNTLLLADSKVSRFHVRIERLDQAWVLVDLGSTNGTRLNGVPVTRAGLAQGDFLYMGDTIVAVEAQAVPSPGGLV
ncbi:MAG TPA: FHA domain-containing protein, partial [Armatimonadota bacterium]|nr:FHA domain-containing protein [Armatimonadota bacterium]